MADASMHVNPPCQDMPHSHNGLSPVPRPTPSCDIGENNGLGTHVTPYNFRLVMERLDRPPV